MGGINLNETGKKKKENNIFTKLGESYNRIEIMLEQIKSYNFKGKCPNFIIEINKVGIETIDFYE